MNETLLKTSGWWCSMIRLAPFIRPHLNIEDDIVPFDPNGPAFDLLRILLQVLKDWFA